MVLTSLYLTVETDKLIKPSLVGDKREQRIEAHSDSPNLFEYKSPKYPSATFAGVCNFSKFTFLSDSRVNSSKSPSDLGRRYSLSRDNDVFVVTRCPHCPRLNFRNLLESKIRTFRIFFIELTPRISIYKRSQLFKILGNNILVTVSEIEGLHSIRVIPKREIAFEIARTVRVQLCVQISQAESDK